MTTLPKREWAEMTWPDFSAADTARWIAVLPLAATEQHGPHLPLGVDSFIAEAYLARVRDLIPADLPVSFLPLQRIGQSDEHVAYPGTLPPPLPPAAATAARAAPGARGRGGAGRGAVGGRAGAPQPRRGGWGIG